VVNPVRLILKTGLDLIAFCCAGEALVGIPTLPEEVPNARGLAELPEGSTTVDLPVAGDGDGEDREAPARGCPAESAIRKT
jgi:hypothetical protein